MSFDSRLKIVIDTLTGERRLRSLRGELEQTEGRGRRAFSNLSRAAVGFSGVLAGLGLGAAFTKAIRNTADYEAQMKSLDAVIKATGQSAGFTSQGLREQAESLALATLQNTRGVMEAQRVLLSFRSISGATFSEALELSADLSTVFGTGLSQSATQLGKALEDPIQGITALRRSGVSFTESQKEVIRQMVETNRVADAQKLILNELQNQVGGAAEGEAAGLSGAFDTLSQRVEEFGLAMGEIANENGAFTDFINQLASGLERVNERLNPDRADRAFQLLQEEIELRSQLQRLREFDPDAIGIEQLEADINRIYRERLELLESEAKAQERSADAVAASQEAEDERLRQQKQEKIEAERERQRKLQQEAERARAAAVGGVINQLEGELLALSLTERELVAHELASEGATQAQIEYGLAAFDAAQKLKQQKAAAEEAKQAALDWYAAQESAYNRLQSLLDQTDPLGADLRSFANEVAIVQDAVARGFITEAQADEIVNALNDPGQFEKAGGNAAEAFLNPWQSAADSVAQSLQNAIASGDWDSIGDAIGGALGASISSIVNKSVTDSLASNVTASSGIFAQIGGAFAGPIAGALAGGVAQLAISELSDFFGGSDWDPTEARQAAQGTGTVLGSIDEKSQSIARAVEGSEAGIGQLVGINQGMLRALQGLQAGISGASARVQRARDGIEFQTNDRFSQEQLAMGGLGVAFGPGGFASGLGPMTFFTGLLGPFGDALDNALGGLFSETAGFLDDLTGGLLSDLGGAIFGGSQEIKDVGIQLFGATLDEMIAGVREGDRRFTAQAFASIEEDGGLFGSDKRFDRFERLGSDAERQISLVFGGIQDSVVAGAEALGFSSAAIAQALSEFRVQTQKISLEGLNAEEQAAELEAVFSGIFDQAAEAVIPFLDEFQRAGEGLGETLSRVANQALITEEAANRLGFQFAELAGRDLAVASERLIEAAGGVESFIGSMEGFISSFANDAQKFAIAQSDISRALAQTNLELPATREQYFALLQAQNGATASGAENIATLLRLQGAADTYYTMLEDRNADLADQQREQLQLAEAASDRVARALESVLGQSESLLTQTREQGLATIRDILNAGVVRDEGRLSNALDAVTSLNPSNFSTLEDFTREQLETASLLTELQALTDEQVTVEERTLQAIENQGSAGLVQHQEQIRALSQINQTLGGQQITATPSVIAPAPVVNAQPIVQSDPATTSELRRLRTDLAATQQAIAKHTAKTARLLERFEIDGLEIRQ